jgi:iron complex outermembrane receptor protein
MIAAFAALLCPFFAMAQFTISGTVTEKNNNTNLAGASIRLKGKSFAASTNADGKYELKNIPAGSYTVSVSFLGYQSQEQTINLSANTSVNFNLAQLAFLANEIVVSGTYHNFIS